MTTRMPLGAIDANRNVPKHTGEKVAKRQLHELEDEENEENEKEGSLNKKRKIDVYTPGLELGNASKDSPTIEVPDSESEESERGDTQRRIEDGIKEEWVAGSLVNSTTQNSSPISSFESSQQNTNLNDSQDTNITEQEDSNGAQLLAREQANALRLRLRIAMYKVHTNQASRPLSQLEIRSSSFSSKNGQRSKLNIPANPTPRLSPALRENIYGEALLVGGGLSSSQSSFQESMSQQTNPNSSFPQVRSRIRPSHTHAHPRLVPYSKQKRRMSLSSVSGSSDIELEIPRRTKKRAGWKRDLENARKRMETPGSFGYPNRVDDDDDSDSGVINIIRAKRVERQIDRSGDELEGAAGGLLELMGVRTPLPTGGRYHV